MNSISISQQRGYHCFENVVSLIDLRIRWCCFFTKTGKIEVLVFCVAGWRIGADGDIKNLSSESYLSWHLFQVCMDFFGQLIAQPRSMPSGIFAWEGK
jgi:hypothetical protein